MTTTTDTPLEEAAVPGWLLWKRFTPAAMRVYQVITRALECGEEIAGGRRFEAHSATGLLQLSPGEGHTSFIPLPLPRRR